MDIGWIIALFQTYPIAGGVGVTLLVLGAVHVFDRFSAGRSAEPGQGAGSGGYLGIEFGSGESGGGSGGWSGGGSDGCGGGGGD